MRFMILLVSIASVVQAQTSITTIQGSDTIQASRTVINNNFASLNANKTESKTLIRDIKDYGAACNGTTDDSAAWTSAINAMVTAGGGTIRVTCFTNVGTTGISIPRTVSGVHIVGNSYFTSKIIYSGTGAAIQIGDSGGFTYSHSVENVQIDITGAGVNAVGIDIYPSLYVRLEHPYIVSSNAHSVGSNNQIAVRATGGSAANSRFGAYLVIRDARINGKFKKGIYMTATDIGWGFNSCLIEGGAIVYSGSPQTGYVGLHIEQGNQNLVTLVDVENFATGFQSEAYDNVFVSPRTEANTLGFLLSAATGGTTGGSYNRIIGGFNGDGITNNFPENSVVFGTNTNVGMENHLAGYNKLDSTLDITGNYAISWSAASGGSSGLFWKNNTGSAVAGIYHNGTSIINLVNGVNVFSIDDTEVTIGSHLKFPAAEGKDIGTDGANRPNNIYAKTNIKGLNGIFSGTNPLVITRGGPTSKGGLDLGWSSARQWFLGSGVPASSDTLLGITEYTDDVFQGVRAAFFKGGRIAFGSTTDDGANLLQVAGNVKSTHLIGGGTSPTISSGFGTTPSIAGKDLAGRVTVGSAPAATGTVAFGSSYVTAPVCFAQNETTGEVLKAVPTTTDLVITQLSGNFVEADKVVFTCKGY